MKIFLRWELDLFLNHLDTAVSRYLSPELVSYLRFAQEFKVDLTVDEARRMVGTQAPHPDGMFGYTPNRGTLYIWEDETPYIRDTDFTIPESIAQAYGLQNVLSGNASSFPV